MQITEMPIKALIPYPKNAKKHDAKQIANVANSIKRFGWQQPIVVDDQNVVVIGHCRLMAAKKLGMKTVPVTVASGLTDEEIRELRIADNKTNESPWDFELLQEDIDGLEFEGFDFDFEDGDVFDYPQKLDDDDYDAQLPFGVKFTFPNYTAYVMYEQELKQTAEKMGAIFAVIKA